MSAMAQVSAPKPALSTGTHIQGFTHCTQARWENLELPLQERLLSIQGAPCATPAGPALPGSWASPRDHPTLGTALPGQGCTSLSHEGVAGPKILPGWIDILQHPVSAEHAPILSHSLSKMLKH